MMDFDKNPMLNEYMVQLDEAKKSLTKIEVLERNAESYIFQYFEDIKNKVDLRREQLKEKIDIWSQFMIESIQTTQSSYLKISMTIYEINMRIEHSKKALNGYLEKIAESGNDQNEFETLKNDVIDLNNKLKYIMLDYNDSLIDYTVYEFRFDEEVPIEITFGSFVGIKHVNL